LNYVFSILIKRFWMISSKVLEFWIDEVFKFLILWVRFSRNRLSLLLPLIRDHYLVDMCSSLMNMSIVIRTWSDKTLSENLVRRFSVGLEISSKNESAISKRVLLWLEWKGKFKSHRLSLMLKSPIIMITLWILISISLRYFKTNWDESE